MRPTRGSLETTGEQSVHSIIPNQIYHFQLRLKMLELSYLILCQIRIVKHYFLNIFRSPALLSCSSSVLPTVVDLVCPTFCGSCLEINWISFVEAFSILLCTFSVIISLYKYHFPLSSYLLIFSAKWVTSHLDESPRRFCLIFLCLFCIPYKISWKIGER